VSDFLNGTSVAVTVTVTVRVTLFNKKLFSDESCSVIGLSEKVSLQLRSELSATDVW